MPTTLEIRFMSNTRTSQRSSFDDNLEYNFSANPIKQSIYQSICLHICTFLNFFPYLEDRSKDAMQRNWRILLLIYSFVSCGLSSLPFRVFETLLSSFYYVSGPLASFEYLGAAWTISNLKLYPPLLFMHTSSSSSDSSFSSFVFKKNRMAVTAILVTGEKHASAITFTVLASSLSKQKLD